MVRSLELCTYTTIGFCLPTMHLRALPLPCIMQTEELKRGRPGSEAKWNQPLGINIEFMLRGSKFNSSHS